jgi:hypothetical protein
VRARHKKPKATRTSSAKKPHAGGETHGSFLGSLHGFRADERVDSSFELTPVGSALRSGPGSFRATARLFGSPVVWQSWGDLLTTVRTGEPAFRRLFKVDSFEYFAAHPEEAAVFDEAMGSFTVMIAGADGWRHIGASRWADAETTEGPRPYPWTSQPRGRSRGEWVGLGSSNPSHSRVH